MENNLNENFTLSEEQIKFIDQRFIINNKCKKLENVVKELVKQRDNNFQKKDIAQIVESYLAIKKKRSVGQCSKDRWTQEELKTLKGAIKEQGQITNVRAFARRLAGTGLLKSRGYKAICKKIFDLKNESPEEYPEIEIKNGKEWTQEELETLDNAIKKEIKEKGQITNVNAFAKRLARTGLFGSRSYKAIYGKIFDLKNESPEKYPEIEIKNGKEWTQEELETLKNAIEKEIKEKGQINIGAFAKRLAGTGLFKSRTWPAIYGKIYDLKSKSSEEHSKIERKNGEDGVQEKPKILDDETNKNLAQRLGELLDKCVKNTEQTGEEERKQQLLDDLQNAGLEFKIEYIGLSFKSSDTSDKEPISRDQCCSLNSSSNEHSKSHKQKNHCIFMK